MNNDKQNKNSALDDVPAAIAAAGYGVPKSLIFGYFMAKIFQGDSAKNKKKAFENYLSNFQGKHSDFLRAKALYESEYGPFQKTSPLHATSVPGATSSNKKPESSNQIRPQGNKLSVMLCVGIVFMPYIFGWFTLRPGYSKTLRVLSFSWMIIVLIKLGSNILKQLAP